MEKLKLICRLLVVISFLLLFVEGEKIGIFMGLYVFMLPFILTNGGHIFELGISKFLGLPIEIAFLGLLYMAIYYLLKRSFKKIDTIKSEYKVLTALLILAILVVRINFMTWAEGNTNFSFFLFYGFFLINLILGLNSIFSNRLTKLDKLA